MSTHDEDVKPLIAMARHEPSLYYNRRLMVHPFNVGIPPEDFKGTIAHLMEDTLKKCKKDTSCSVKECWRINLAKHVRLLEGLIANTTKDGCLQYLIACCKRGHDIHARIPQIEDCLPNFQRGYFEIPFERDNREPEDKRGVPLLEVLFNWKNIRDHDKIPQQLLAMSKNGFLLQFSTRVQGLGCQFYGVRFKCHDHTLSWYDVAINIVYGVIEDLEKGKSPLVSGFDHSTYPILSILHGRLLSLVSEDGKVWWPRFSTATIEPTIGHDPDQRNLFVAW